MIVTSMPQPKKNAIMGFFNRKQVCVPPTSSYIQFAIVKKNDATFPGFFNQQHIKPAYDTQLRSSGLINSSMLVKGALWEISVFDLEVSLIIPILINHDNQKILKDICYQKSFFLSQKIICKTRCKECGLSRFVYVSTCFVMYVLWNFNQLFISLFPAFSVPNVLV